MDDNERRSPWLSCGTSTYSTDRERKNITFFICPDLEGEFAADEEDVNMIVGSDEDDEEEDFEGEDDDEDNSDSRSNRSAIRR